MDNLDFQVFYNCQINFMIELLHLYNLNGKLCLTSIMCKNHITLIVKYTKQMVFLLEISFNNKKLQTLYETGKSNRYKLDKQIIESFFEVVAILEAAKDIHDLWNMPSLNFEKLKGHVNRFSARLNKKWRLEMSIEWKNEIMTIGIISLEEISNHYGG